MTVIVLDPGHGGNDPGTSGFGLVEKKLALNIAKKVQNILRETNITVHMTRTTDTFIALSDRASMANDYDADLFVSFHHNAGGGEGFESYIYPGLRDTETGSIQDKLHTSMMGFYAPYDLRDRGKKEANFAVLRETKMPAILLENLFLDSEQDTTLLKQDVFIDNLSTTIAEKISASIS